MSQISNEQALDAINSFHSINVPSEWGLDKVLNQPNSKVTKCFHSINVPSEWGLHLAALCLPQMTCFHSINVPSEWGLVCYTLYVCY